MVTVGRLFGREQGFRPGHHGAVRAGAGAWRGRHAGQAAALGVAKAGKLLVGAPGYPVSAVVCFERLLYPLACWLTRSEPRRRQTVTASLARSVPSRLGMVDFVRLAVGQVGERYGPAPLPRGAGSISTMTKAQAVTQLPADAEGLEAGAEVTAELLVDAGELERTLVCVGSHDNTLDMLADLLMRRLPSIRLASSHVGSMGGLIALRNDAAMIAGSHLLDPATGDYNFPLSPSTSPAWSSPSSIWPSASRA